MEAQINVYPHKIFNYRGKEYIFMGYGSAIYELDDVESLIIANSGKTIDEIKKIVKIKTSEKESENVDEIVEELKKHNVVVNEETDKKYSDLLNAYSEAKPNSVTLMLCQECNLRCRYCYAENGEYMNPGIMPEEIGKKAIEYIANLDDGKDRFDVIMFGGEPLMDFKKIKNLVEYAKQVAKEKNKEVGFSITTNGTLLTEEIEQYLLKEKFNITLSLDGGKCVNDKNRFFPNGQGAYESTIKKTELLRKEKRVGIRGTITAVDTDLLGRWMDLKDLGVRNVNFSQSVNMMEDNDYDSMIESYKQSIDYYCEMLKSKNRSEIKTMGYVSKIFDRIKGGGIRMKNCGAGNNMIAVDKDGNIYPCHRLVNHSGYRVGDVFSGINEDLHHNLEKGMLISNYSGCKDCWLASFCSGGCVQENLVTNGRGNEAYENNCRMMKAVVEYAVEKYLEMLNEGIISA